MTDMGSGQIAYDPRGVVAAVKKPLAARLTGLEGLRLGVLDNTKWNANKLLRGAMARLQDEAGLVNVSYYRKESFSKTADPLLLDEIRANSDIVLTAIGD